MINDIAKKKEYLEEIYKHLDQNNELFAKLKLNSSDTNSRIDIQSYHLSNDLKYKFSMELGNFFNSSINKYYNVF